MLKVLVACEESQRVCTAFRELGHEAYSADIQEPSGGHPEWHILGDVLEVLNPSDHLGDFEASDRYISFKTMDGSYHEVEQWDIIIAHPPCTYLTVSGNAWFNTERYGKKAEDRWKDRVYAAVFFMRFMGADCKKICVENPVGIMSRAYRKADQIIQPYQFGHHAMKTTCLWLKGLRPLVPTDVVDPGEFQTASTGTGRRYNVGSGSSAAKDENGKILAWNDPRTAKERSKTYEGIAKAMAEQWG